MTEQKLYRRLVRRSLHRSRSAAIIVALVAVSLAAAYVGTEATLAALGLGPLLVTPDAVLASVENPGQIELIIAGAAALVGLVLIVLALVPGRRGRHQVASDRLAVVVDDAVLAGALSRVVRREAAVAESRVRTMVSARRGSVAVTPTSGVPLNAAALTASARDYLDALELSPAVRANVSVASSGVVGS
jgi:hypothetical protein